MDSTIHTQQDNVNSRSGQFGFAINGERTKHRVRLVTNRSDRDSGERCPAATSIGSASSQELVLGK